MILLLIFNQRVLICATIRLTNINFNLDFILIIVILFLPIHSI